MRFAGHFLFKDDYSVTLKHLSVWDVSAASSILISGTVMQDMTMLELKACFKLIVDQFNRRKITNL